MMMMVCFINRMKMYKTFAEASARRTLVEERIIPDDPSDDQPLLQEETFKNTNFDDDTYLLLPSSRFCSYLAQIMIADPKLWSLSDYTVLPLYSRKLSPITSRVTGIAVTKAE